MVRWITLVVLAACGGAPLQTIKVVNLTDRQIEAIYVFPTGAKDRGPSRGGLAPQQSTQVRMKAGAVDVEAISSKIKDTSRRHTGDTPTTFMTSAPNQKGRIGLCNQT